MVNPVHPPNLMPAVYFAQIRMFPDGSLVAIKPKEINYLSLVTKFDNVQDAGGLYFTFCIKIENAVISGNKHSFLISFNI